MESITTSGLQIAICIIHVCIIMYWVDCRLMQMLYEHNVHNHPIVMYNLRLMVYKF